MFKALPHDKSFHLTAFPPGSQATGVHVVPLFRLVIVSPDEWPPETLEGDKVFLAPQPSFFDVRREKAAIVSGCDSHPASVAPAGSTGGGGRRQRLPLKRLWLRTAALCQEASRPQASAA
jgi:hypothetical protein